MAGSIKWVLYRSDDGADYAVRMDESNSKAGGFTDAPALVAQKELPKGRKMRYVNVKHAASGATRRLYLGTPANPLKNGGSVKLPFYGAKSQSDVDFVVQSFKPEQARKVFGYDTGLNDGDAE